MKVLYNESDTWENIDEILNKRSVILNAVKLLESEDEASYTWEAFHNYNGELIYLSPSFNKLTGYDREEFLNGSRLLSEIIRYEDLEKFNIFKNSPFEKKPADSILRVIDPSAQLRSFSVTYSPAFDPGNVVKGSIISFVSTVDERKINDNLFFREQVLMLILNHTNQGIILVDDEGRIKGWNKCVGIVAGFSKENVQGDKIWKVQYRLATENVRANITEEALREFWENEVLSMKPGELLTSYGAINNASGEVEYIQDMIRAIELDGRKYFCIFQTYFTAHKKVEDELRQKVDELATANRELELFAYTNNELKQFAYIASHQLQEPARTIMNYLKIIEEDYSLLDDKLKKYLGIVRCAAERMSSLNNTLLDYSRIGRKSKMALADCNQVLKTVISDLDYLICETGATIICDKLPELKIFEKEFYLLLLNLISNAIKFRKKGVNPEIHIGAELSGNEYRFSVTDNGIGIEQAHFERIFDIFQRLYVDEDEYEGKGVGLAYCRKIVNMHAGKIWVESVPGAGSVFNFTIPFS